MEVPGQTEQRHSNGGRVRAPNDPKLPREAHLLERLASLSPGRDDAHAYEYVAACLVQYVFRGQLANLRMHFPVVAEDGRYVGYVDFVMSNRAKSGFFCNLPRKFRMSVPKVYFECKNYRADIRNVDFDQMAFRLSKANGQVGFILCRNIRDRRALRHKQQRRRLVDKKLIVVLTDQDLSDLVALRQDGDQDGISTYLENLIDRIL